MIREDIKKLIDDALGELKFKLEEFPLEHPGDIEHGDYATSAAFMLAKPLKKNPQEIASCIAEGIKNKQPSVIEKVEAAGGFVNFFVSKEYFLKELSEILKEKEKYGESTVLKNKKYLIEHTSPNTIKTLHVGHVRNNVLGMAVKNLLESAGAKVKLDAINNDRGIHVMKANWAYLQYGRKSTQLTLSRPKRGWKDLLNEWSKKKTGWKVPGEMKGDKFADQFYILGVQAEDRFNEVKEEMQEMLKAWENGDPKVRSLWKQLRDWVFEGFLETYKRLDSKHDHQWFESNFYEKGREIVIDGLKKNIFRKLQDGAILTDLSKYGLSDTIVLRADGTTMYHTQDLQLTKLKRKKFPSDLYIWDIGPEQTLYLKQLFAICEQLGIGKKEDYSHMSYGYVYLKDDGKMSSRKGNAVSADWLLDEMSKRAKTIIKHSKTERGLSKKEQESIAEGVGMGAIKYGFLKVGRTTDIQFSMKEALALEGDSGPYLQYTFARCQSILRKSKSQSSKFKIENYSDISKEELDVLRVAYKFPEVMQEAVEKFSPNFVCNYVFDLAQKYNTFYNSHRVLEAETKETKEFRLLLTAATAQLIQNSLTLLGIKSLKRM